MAEFFLGQIMMTGFGFAQRAFAQCNGQLLPTQQNQALFTLLGTYYGGNGTSNFALPDMRSRTPLGAGFGSIDPSWQPGPAQLGQSAGTENVTLLQSQLPVHTHTVAAGTTASSDSFPASNYTFGKVEGGELFTASPPSTTLWPQTVSATGGGQPHPNIQPFSTINFNIALQGTYPSRS
ncbi:phage tail protein [Sphingomonas sp. CJ20]